MASSNGDKRLNTYLSSCDLKGEAVGDEEEEEDDEGDEGELGLEDGASSKASPSGEDRRDATEVKGDGVINGGGEGDLLSSLGEELLQPRCCAS